MMLIVVAHTSCRFSRQRIAKWPELPGYLLVAALAYPYQNSHQDFSSPQTSTLRGIRYQAMRFKTS